ncbi:hypothetical protein GIB23_14260 [Pseudomonas putida]|uniref:hypothetical protein n=1 Tax=Pseudomonas TaxID=286 RepID=UPI00164530F6|nr:MULTISPECIES: hypothetical protein [Pseudomonas]MBO0368262.1 hypothetical protein [Pseudomonas putida]MBV4500284.1 hypothetical protein [Pseudomonas shirazensis]
MRKDNTIPFYAAGGSMLVIGIVFAAVGASGQPAFSWTAVGLLIPSAVLLLQAVRRKRGSNNDGSK